MPEQMSDKAARDSKAESHFTIPALCHAWLRCAMLCYGMLCYAVACCAMVVPYKYLRANQLNVHLSNRLQSTAPQQMPWQHRTPRHGA